MDTQNTGTFLDIKRGRPQHAKDYEGRGPHRMASQVVWLFLQFAMSEHFDSLGASDDCAPPLFFSLFLSNERDGYDPDAGVGLGKKPTRCFAVKKKEERTRKGRVHAFALFLIHPQAKKNVQEPRQKGGNGGRMAGRVCHGGEMV